MEGRVIRFALCLPHQAHSVVGQNLGLKVFQRRFRPCPTRNEHEKQENARRQTQEQRRRQALMTARAETRPRSG